METNIFRFSFAVVVMWYGVFCCGDVVVWCHLLWCRRMVSFVVVIRGWRDWTKTYIRYFYIFQQNTLFIDSPVPKFPNN